MSNDDLLVYISDSGENPSERFNMVREAMEPESLERETDDIYDEADEVSYDADFYCMEIHHEA